MPKKVTLSKVTAEMKALVLLEMLQQEIKKRFRMKVTFQEMESGVLKYLVQGKIPKSDKYFSVAIDPALWECKTIEMVLNTVDMFIKNEIGTHKRA